jgi:hypothetical protein
MVARMCCGSLICQAPSHGFDDVVAAHEHCASERVRGKLVIGMDLCDARISVSSTARTRSGVGSPTPLPGAALPNGLRGYVSARPFNQFRRNRSYRIVFIANVGDTPSQTLSKDRISSWASVAVEPSLTTVPRCMT